MRSLPQWWRQARIGGKRQGSIHESGSIISVWNWSRMDQLQLNSESRGVKKNDILLLEICILKKGRNVFLFYFFIILFFFLFFPFWNPILGVIQGVEVLTLYWLNICFLFVMTWEFLGIGVPWRTSVYLLNWHTFFTVTNQSASHTLLVKLDRFDFHVDVNSDTTESKIWVLHIYIFYELLNDYKTNLFQGSYAYSKRLA